MTYANVNIRMIKHQMGAVYQELNELRNQVEMLEYSDNKDIHAFEKLGVLGERIRKNIGPTSTKDIIDDVRG